MKLVVISILAFTAVASVRGFKPITGRSSRWDQMILEHETRHKRLVSTWQTDSLPCILGNVQRFDALGRRGSHQLAPVADQGRLCGNCWAFSAAHAVTDTRNLAPQVTQTELLSVEYTTRCVSEKYGYGCCGDSPENAFVYYKAIGAATDTCLPYNQLSSFSSFGNDTNTKKKNQLFCFSTCEDKLPINPGAQKIKDYLHYSSLSDDEIIAQLNKSRTVSAGMIITKEFMRYGCGIFCPTENSGHKHSVEIVDYGTTNTGVNFWVIKNSWGSGWGEGGYFRIIRGGALEIGRLDIDIPLLPNDPETPTLNSNSEAIETCAPEEVSQPKTDTMTMSALEFALKGLINNQRVRCPNGEAATNYTLISFQDADVQVVAGMLVDLTVRVSLGGCGTTVIKDFDLTVTINPNGMFTLQSFSAANILTASMLLLIIVLIIGIVVN